MSHKDWFIVLHNVSSAGKCVDFVKVAISLGYRNIVISKATGGAATGGVPSAQKYVAQKGGNLFYLSGLEDLKEIFNIEEIILIAPPGYGKEKLNKKLIEELKSADNVKRAIVFGGNDPGLSRKELEMGRSVQLELTEDPGTIGTAAIVLNMLNTMTE